MFGLCSCSKIYDKLSNLTDALVVLNKKQDSLLKKIDTLQIEIKRIRRLQFAQIRPKIFSLVLINERIKNMTSFLKYRVELPEVPAEADVDIQKFEVVANGEIVTSQVYGKDVTEVEFEVAQDTNVALSLYYTDDAGNDSGVTTTEFVALDVLAPEAPGAFGSITLIGERQEDAPETDTPVTE